MRDTFKDYTLLLHTFTCEEQINKINQKINELSTKKHQANFIDTRYDRIKLLKQIKNSIINSNKNIL